MSARSARIDLTNIQNWPELAAQVHYQASLLAEHWHMNRRALEREFRKQLKTTPQRHLDSVRLGKAAKRAQAGGRTKDIANELEYKQASHFCKQFSDFYGMGARTYRNDAA